MTYSKIGLMTKKQIILLIALASIGLLIVVFVSIWQFPFLFQKGSSTAVGAFTPVLTEEPAVNSGATDPVEAQVGWPTVTPRSISQATPTPEAVVHAQVTVKPLDTVSSESEKALTEANPTAIPPTQTVQVNSGYDEDQYPFSIGQSRQGAELWVYKFGNGEIEKLIVAGIHGGYEYNTTDLANEFIAYIEEHPEIIPEHITLYILPSFNPDGLARSRGYAGRANANNVDLNRNWDFNWKDTWDPAGCWAYLPIFGGEAPFSEPEAAALRDFIHAHEFSALISYHSAALGIFPGGVPDVDLSVGLAEAVSEVAPYPYPPIQTGCEITGQFVDYTASYGIPSLDIELTNHKDSDFDINLEVLKVFLNWLP